MEWIAIPRSFLGDNPFRLSSSKVYAFTSVITERWNGIFYVVKSSPCNRWLLTILRNYGHQVGNILILKRKLSFWILFSRDFAEKSLVEQKTKIEIRILSKLRAKKLESKFSGQQKFRSSGILKVFLAYKNAIDSIFYWI